MQSHPPRAMRPSCTCGVLASLATMLLGSSGCRQGTRFSPEIDSHWCVLDSDLYAKALSRVQCVPGRICVLPFGARYQDEFVQIDLLIVSTHEVDPRYLSLVLSHPMNSPDTGLRFESLSTWDAAYAGLAAYWERQAKQSASEIIKLSETHDVSLSEPCIFRAMGPRCERLAVLSYSFLRRDVGPGDEVVIKIDLSREGLDSLAESWKVKPNELDVNTVPLQTTVKRQRDP